MVLSGAVFASAGPDFERPRRVGIDHTIFAGRKLFDLGRDFSLFQLPVRGGRPDASRRDLAGEIGIGIDKLLGALDCAATSARGSGFFVRRALRLSFGVETVVPQVVAPLFSSPLDAFLLPAAFSLRLALAAAPIAA